MADDPGGQRLPQRVVDEAAPGGEKRQRQQAIKDQGNAVGDEKQAGGFDRDQGGEQEAAQRIEAVAQHQAAHHRDTVAQQGLDLRRLPAEVQASPHQPQGQRSEEHTSELQSLMRISYAVFCLKTKTKRAQKSYNDSEQR